MEEVFKNFYRTKEQVEERKRLEKEKEIDQEEQKILEEFKDAFLNNRKCIVIRKGIFYPTENHEKRIFDKALARLKDVVTVSTFINDKSESWDDDNLFVEYKICYNF